MKWILVLLLAGCAIDYTYDPIMRKPLPKACQKDLTDIVKANIVRVEQKAIAIMSGNEKAVGIAFLELKDRPIWIDELLIGWRFDAVKHHEECHFVKGRFHD